MQVWNMQDISMLGVFHLTVNSTEGQNIEDVDMILRGPGIQFDILWQGLLMRQFQMLLLYRHPQMIPFDLFHFVKA